MAFNPWKSLTRRWCTMRAGALAATLCNVLLLTFFILQSLQSPFSKRHLIQIGKMLDMQRQVLLAAEEHFTLGSPSADSYYKPWIRKDLSTWAEKGISLDLVDEMASRYKECFGEVLRFQILNGTLWVDHISERHNGWYPAAAGPGGVSGKGKIPYAILALMDAIRHHPGQIPDMDAVLQTSDFPCMLHQPPDSEIITPPVFGYNSHDTFADVPFPDYTYWGHEYSWLLGPEGYYLHGWEKQFKFLSTKWEKVSLADRIAQVMWRGRTMDKEFPNRDELRRQFAQCPEELIRMNRAEEAELFNLKTPEISLHDTCNFRYPMYIESAAWVTNLKQKLACGSILVSNQMEYYEFFTRALQPNVHYIEVDSNNICVDTAEKVLVVMNLLGWEGDKVKMMNQAFDRMPELAAPVEAKLGAVKSRRTLRQRLPEGNWSTAPWNVGMASQEFMAKHVRMEDVRLYIRDVLKEYAALQTFRPKPTWNSVCYTGELLLDQFGFPHEYDRKVVLQAYPWLRKFATEECRGKLPRKLLPKPKEQELEELYES